jgi:hypothetical protein
VTDSSRVNGYMWERRKLNSSKMKYWIWSHQSNWMVKNMLVLGSSRRRKWGFRYSGDVTNNGAFRRPCLVRTERSYVDPDRTSGGLLPTWQPGARLHEVLRIPPPNFWNEFWNPWIKHSRPPDVKPCRWVADSRRFGEFGALNIQVILESDGWR